jgi:hypothetical protein
MSILLLLTQSEPDSIVKNFSGILFTIAVVVGIFVLIRGIYNGSSLKDMAMEIIAISLVAGITLKPMFFANIGTVIIKFFISLTKNLTV